MSDPGMTPLPGAGGAAGDPGGPRGPDGATGDDHPWYARPAVIVPAALVGLGAIVVILVLALGGDDDPSPTTVIVPTTSTTSTTVQTTDRDCRAGDQIACDQLSDAQLDGICTEGVTAACQVLLARQGEGVPDDPPADRGGAP